MPVRLLAAVALSVVSVLAFAASAVAEDGRYIVVFKDSVERPGNVASAQVEKRDGRLGFVYRNALKGYSAVLPKESVEALRNDPRVDFVVVDGKVESFAQEVPTGIDRAFATANSALDIDGKADMTVDVDIAVIDSGVDREHPDLDVVARTDCSQGNEKEASCVDGTGTDTNGHGTHVAGTAAAIDNGQGVVGVAPGARVWAVKVLDGGGFGWDSEVAAGVDWVTGHADEIEVANMSLGGAAPKPTIAKAIEGSVDAGVVYVVAAGNNFSNANLFAPANHPDAITVSAIADFDGQPGSEAGSTECREAYDDAFLGSSTDDSRALFSNFGAVIDVAAPGVCIRSTVPGGGYGELGWWGTSMASPHVAGAAALLASVDNPQNQADVNAIRNTIVAEGNFNWTDTSPDGITEPLLDVSDESVFYLPGPSALTTSAASIGRTKAKLQGVVNPHGAATTYRFEYGTTTAYGTKVPIPDESVGSGTEPVPATELVEGLLPGTTYHFRLIATGAGITRHGEDLEFTTPTLVRPVYERSVGSKGTGGGKFTFPAGIAFDAEGNMRVADCANNRVQKLSAAGTYISSFGSSGTGNGKFDCPFGVAYADDGSIWVSDIFNDRVQRFSASGEYLGQFGSEGSGNGQFKLATGIAIDSAGHLWVVDYGNNRVQEFTGSGTYVGKFGSTGSGNGQFEQPYGIAINAAGNLLVSDANGVQELTTSGTFVRRFGTKGTGAGQIDSPNGIAIDGDGHVLIADAGTDRISAFTASGTFITSFGTSGSGAGQLNGPTGLAFDPEGDLWVSETENHRLQEWAAW